MAIAQVWCTAILCMRQKQRQNFRLLPNAVLLGVHAVDHCVAIDSRNIDVDSFSPWPCIAAVKAAMPLARHWHVK